MFSDLVSDEVLATRRENLDKVAIYDRFRFFYALKGVDALPAERHVDRDNSGTPDYIERLAQRFIRVDKFYREEVGLTSPLDGDRYRGHALYIDVNLLNLPNHKNGPMNGIAYDGTPKLDRAAAGEDSVNVLLIDLSASLSWENRSVEHELFHLYQNGYTYFKNPWYTEGTARWSELVMNGRLGPGGLLPNNRAQKRELFRKTYAASAFWNELILRCNKAELGKTFIRKLLERLSELDSIAAKERGIPSTNWQESEQRSEDNDPYIWRAVIETIESLGYPVASDKEMKTLFDLSGV